MKKKLFLALLLPLSLLTFNTYAAQPPEPQHCPTAASIISVGVSHNMVEDSDGLWFTGRRNQKYGTSNNWTFVLAKITATSVNDAYSKAVGGLSTLSFQLGPYIGPIGKWVCYYKTSEDFTAFAVYPPVARNVEKQFFDLKP